MEIYLEKNELEDAIKILNMIDKFKYFSKFKYYDYAFNNIKSIESYNSGGGCNHIFFHLKNNHIISYHYDTETIEYSYSKYKDIYDYMDSDDDMKGFGYEPNQPFYNNRSAENINLRVEGI